MQYLLKFHQLYPFLDNFLCQKKISKKVKVVYSNYKSKKKSRGRPRLHQQEFIDIKRFND